MSLILTLLLSILVANVIRKIILLCFKINDKRKANKITKIAVLNPKSNEIEWEYNEATNLWEPKDKSRIIAAKPTVNYNTVYQAKRILTNNEQVNYRNLKAAADKKNYLICPKVRLLDIVEPRAGQQKYKMLLNKVQAKHVDFVICDQGMNIKAIIELDDRSHLRKDRIERDQFVDALLKDVGYKVIHTWSISENILDEI